MSSLKKRDKIQNIREAGTPKSSFLTIPKRIHTISLRERLLKASENGSRTAKHPSSNSPKGRVGQDAPTNSPVRRVGSVQLAERVSWIEQAILLARSASWINQPAFVPSS
ncbi:hypothetical protein F2Q69_00059172 [Brassica cretica]|uniref:Uncharacterized protein n=1 Tax=Brassica cretica TaxID=69181 RepID=A0A8S9RH69_BRACR|nr:hypothetical protein F2Q69_00059172 [Brassica cretica]